MPTFEDAVADADEVQQALRGLAHATRHMSDPSDGYAVLGSLTQGLASLEFALTQFARFYETTAREQAEVHGDREAGHASTSQVADHLRTSSELVAHAMESIVNAHNSDAEVNYIPAAPARTAPRHATKGRRTKPTAAQNRSTTATPASTVEENGPWL